MKKIIGLIFLIIITVLYAGCSGAVKPSGPAEGLATATPSVSMKLYNAGSSPWVSAVMEDSLGNILIAGEQNSVDLMALKLDSSGTQAWNKFYTSGSTFAAANNIFETGTGYMIAGSINNASGSLFRMALASADGTSSAATYHDCGGYQDSVSNDAARLADGTIVYAGSSEYANDCTTMISYGNAMTTGISAAGTQAYRYSYNYATGYSEAFNAVVALSGGGTAVAGYAHEYDDGSGYSGPDQAILVKYSGGTPAWTQNYSYNTDDGGNAGVVDLVETSDNGFALLLWSGYGYQMKVIKTDSAGVLSWSANVGGGNSSYKGSQIVEASDGGLVIAGTGSYNYSQAGGVIKISGSNGAVVWQYYSADYTPTAICKLAAGGYIAAGGYNAGLGTYKVFAYKLNNDGQRVW